MSAQPTTADLSGLAPEWIDPRRTALVIVDMQVDFAAPRGAVGAAGTSLGGVPGALAAATRLAAAARRVGAAVIFVGLQTAADTDSSAWSERIRRRGGEPSSQLALCRIGTPGAAFHGPQPEIGDLVIAKSRYSAFFGSDLAAVLAARRIGALVVCGMTTACCVDSTVRDAFHLDYHVFVVADACADYDRQLHDATVRNLGMNFAIIVSTDQVAAAWAGANTNLQR